MHRSLRIPWTFVGLLIATVAAERVSAAPGVFEGRGNWLDPLRASVSDAELSFGDAPAPHFRNEALYVTGRLDNGWVFTTGFFGWRVGPLRGYGAYALLGRPDGTRAWVLRQLRRDQIEIGSGHLDLRSDGVTFEGNGSTYTAVVRTDSLSLELRLESILPAWRPGDGLSRLSDDPTVFTRLSMPTPWARVAGWVTVDGTRVAVRGQAYSDLTLSVIPPDRLPPETTCFRLWSPPGTPDADRWFLSVVEYVSHPAFGSVRQPILLLGHGSEWVLTTPHFTMSPRESADTAVGSYPSRVQIRADDQGYTLTGEYRTGALYETTDMFREIPPPLRPIVALFAKRSINFRSFGVFEGTLTDPAGVSHKLALSGAGEYLVVK